MKKNLLYTFLAAFMMFASCSKIDRDLTLTKGVAPVLTNPTGEDRAYVLTEENQDNPFETFIYTAAEYGTPIAAIYTVEVDTIGGDFSTPAVSTTSSTQLFQTLKTSDFNLLVNQSLKRLPEVEHTVQVRVRAEAADPAVEKLFSNVIELKVTPFDASIPPKYVVGSSTDVGWDAGKAIPMPALDLSLFKVRIKLKAVDKEGKPTAFRFLGQQDWNPVNYYHNTFDKVEVIPAGAIEADVANQYGEVNFKVITAGTYDIEMNLDNDGQKTIKFTKVEE